MVGSITIVKELTPSKEQEVCFRFVYFVFYILFLLLFGFILNACCLGRLCFYFLLFLDDGY